MTKIIWDNSINSISIFSSVKNNFTGSRRVLSLLIVTVILAAAGCQSTPDVVKIGLVAPFEGADRAVGYDAIYAARLAVREINAAGGIDGSQIALVALDDRGDLDQALKNGRLLLADPAVVAVLGHGVVSTTAAMRPVYLEDGLAFIPLSQPPFGPFEPAALPADFTAAYEAVTPFEEQPGPLAAPTYDGMQLVFEALRQAMGTEGKITRQSVAKYLPKSSHQGITGTVSIP